MDNSNRNRTPAELQEIEARLRDERPTASALDLDRIKLQAIRQVERSRPSLYALKKGTLMKSRLALTLVLVAGFMLSTTGATLAISGSSGSGSAAENQYVSPAKEEGGNHGVKGAHDEGKTLNGPGPGAAKAEVQPAAAEQQAVVADESSGTLPFTGFLAIPLLIIGVGLIGFGAMMRFKIRDRTAAGH
jgi:hypothetical protein